MPHVKSYSRGTHMINGKPTFYCRIERTNGENNALVNLFRVPKSSIDGSPVRWARNVSNEIIEGKTAVVYVEHYGGFTREEVIKIVASQLELYRAEGK